MDFIHRKKFKYVVSRIAFPNGKICTGKDIGYDGHTLRYFGSWDHRLVEVDFCREELEEFTITRTILFESEDKKEVGQAEMRLIVELRANDPDVGYNRTPKFRQ